MIGIIGALREEVDGLIAKLSAVEAVSYAGIDFYCGRIFDHEVVVALSGVGKVNASMTASFMLAHYPKISAIINIGVAGGIANGAKQGDLIVASAAVQHDFTLNSSDAPIGQIPGFEFVEFECDPYLIGLAEEVLIANSLSFIHGIIATGDQFINSSNKSEWLRTQFGAVACDMESAAIAHVCHKAQIRFLSMRAVSDSGDDEADFDFLEWLSKAAQMNISFICSLLKRLKETN